MAIQFGKKGERKIKAIRKREQERAAKKIAEKNNLPYLSLQFAPIQPSALEIIPEEEAREAGIAVFNKKGGLIQIGVKNPSLQRAQDVLSSLKRRYAKLEVFVVSDASLERAWGHYPPETREPEIGGKLETSPQLLKKLKEEIKTQETLGAKIQEISQKETTRVLEVILGGALNLRASDIHIERREATTLLRFRIDGVLYDITELKERAYKLLLSRIKLLSELKLNIHDTAQDGRFSIILDKLEIEIRTSALPGEYGENIVMRILNPQSLLSLEDLGLRKDLLAEVAKQISRPNGMILTTGPTGSGKTTTLYAFLKKLATPKIKIITLEDPIEYHLENISQTQVAPDKGYTFASGLRSILRQDPDVILVGEIRDLETADTALNAALTGHIVFSTLHTNDAAGTIPRLIDIGANTAIIGPALNMAIAQRLVRELCSKCKKPYQPTAKQKQILGIKNKKKIYRANPKGCTSCRQGYKGRIGLFEILVVTPAIEKQIPLNPSIQEVRELAKKEGMTTLKDDAILKILEGTTSIEEVERVLGPLETAGNINGDNAKK